MKKNSFTIYFIDSIIIVLIVINLVTCINTNPTYNYINVESIYNNYHLSSNYLEKKVEIDEVTFKEKKEISTETVEKDFEEETKQDKDEKIKEETKKQEEISTKNVKQEEKIVEKKEVDTSNTVITNNSYSVIETLTGTMSGYGPDCYGCTSKKTSSGKYIGDGEIFYEDKTFGKVRIVAGDKKYPYGTIVRIVGYYNEDIYAVVLDRGGNIGIDKKFMFDLLFETEKEASKMGTKKNIKFEILRLGY